MWQAVSIALTVAVTVGGRDAAQFTPDRPPNDVRQLLEQLISRRGTAQEQAVAQLSRLDLAEPYLRLLTTDDPIVRRQADSALVRVRRTICEQALDQHGKRWVRDGRLDLLVELGCLTTDIIPTGRVGDAAYEIVSKLDAGMGVHPSGNCPPVPLLNYDARTRFSAGINGFTRATDGVLTNPSATTGGAYALSLTCQTDVSEKWYCLCLVGDRLTESGQRHREWVRSLVVVNNATDLYSLDTAIAVVDGDVELSNVLRFNPSISRSVVISSGSIRCKGLLGFSSSLICARGDIAVGGITRSHTSHLYAGGTVDLGKGKPGEGTVVKEKADLSFTGIRFFELSDVGVEAEAHPDGARIAKLKFGSPLARYGVRVGDVVTKLNDQPMTSVNELRRHVRRSVAHRAGIFQVKRDGEALTRIVYFHDPLPGK